MPRPSQPATRPTDRNPLVRAFSLIEMLVVLLILTVVIAIVVPALRHFRDVARKSATQEMMASLATAVNQFKLSQSRLPGYFSAKQMGDNLNNGSGFSAMDNIMLDLAGGVTPNETVAGGGDPCIDTNYSVIQVGPDPASWAKVSINRIGGAEGGAKGTITNAYFKPDPKYFVRQCVGIRQRAVLTGTDQRLALPALVDSWGSPLLAWVSSGVPTSLALSSIDSSSPAQFYLSSNACFTNASGLGKLGQDQNDADNGSFLATMTPIGAPVASLAAIVENPVFSNEPRGAVIFHSAGANGVYVGRQERGGKSSGNTLVHPPRRDIFQEGDFDDFVIRAE